ncbi:YchF family ATPase [Patescibacteria group bacterium]|nr:YchF family ATPase [Patescibacteria group bacterium]
MLKVGIVGLPNSGKSTLFNALLQRQIADVAEYPFTTIEPNVGVVQVPDLWLEKISQATKINKMVPAVIEFIDIAGLVAGAYKGEGLGNKFLGQIREVDAILHLVRGFHNPNVEGSPDPEKDIKIIKEELKQGEIEKPTMYILNVDESLLNKEETNKLISKVTQIPSGSILPISAKLESELSELSAKDRKEYLNELGLEHLALDQVIKKCYELFGLITFFTIAGSKQVQAWPVPKSTKAVDAAGVVHTDMEKGFVKAEVMSWEKLISVVPLRQGFEGQALGAWKTAAEKGLVRLEGKDYEIKDGDVIEFKFNI